MVAFRLSIFRYLCNNFLFLKLFFFVFCWRFVFQDTVISLLSLSARDGDTGSRPMREVRLEILAGENALFWFTRPEYLSVYVIDCNKKRSLFPFLHCYPFRTLGRSLLVSWNMKHMKCNVCFYTLVSGHLPFVATQVNMILVMHHESGRPRIEPCFHGRAFLR